MNYFNWQSIFSICRAQRVRPEQGGVELCFDEWGAVATRRHL